MRVLCIIASVIVILVPVLIYIASTRQGWKVSPNRRTFLLHVLLPNTIGLLVSLAVLYLAGVFRNFY